MFYNLLIDCKYKIIFLLFNIIDEKILHFDCADTLFLYLCKRITELNDDKENKENHSYKFYCDGSSCCRNPFRCFELA